MACYKARGFLQKAESLGLTALGLGRECLGFAMTRSTMLPKCTSKARRSWRAFLCTVRLTTQKRYDCSAAFPCTEVLCTNSTLARLYFLNVL